MTNTEQQVEDLIKRGEIDRVIEIYQSLKPYSSRTLNMIGTLYGENKGDYELAVYYLQQALEIQEQNDEDTSDTLTELGVNYRKLRQYDLALIHHFRALKIRQLAHTVDRKLVANSFFGIANAYWGQQNLSEALHYGKQALILNESIESDNELNIATNQAILANIYHSLGDDIQALTLAKQALIVLEHSVPSDSMILVSLLNNIATIKISMGLIDEALLIFARVLHICEKILPEGHPKRVIIINNIEQMRQIQQHNGTNSFSYVWQFYTKMLTL